MSHNNHRVSPNMALYKQCKAAFKDGTWCSLPHNWQAKLTSQECHRVFRVKAKVMLGIAQMKKKMPRGWDKGLTEIEKQKCYSARGFYQDKVESEITRCANAGVLKQKHSARFHEILSKIESGETVYFHNGHKLCDGMHRWEARILKKQMEQRKNAEIRRWRKTFKGFNHRATEIEVYAMANNRKDRHARKVVRRFIAFCGEDLGFLCADYLWDKYERHCEDARMCANGESKYIADTLGEIRRVATLKHRFFIALWKLRKEIARSPYSCVRNKDKEWCGIVHDKDGLLEAETNYILKECCDMKRETDEYYNSKVISSCREESSASENQRQLRALGFVA